MKHMCMYENHDNDNARREHTHTHTHGKSKQKSVRHRSESETDVRHAACPFRAHINLVWIGPIIIYSTSNMTAKANTSNNCLR